MEIIKIKNRKFIRRNGAITFVPADNIINNGNMPIVNWNGNKQLIFDDFIVLTNRAGRGYFAAFVFDINLVNLLCACGYKYIEHKKIYLCYSEESNVIPNFRLLMNKLNVKIGLNIMDYNRHKFIINKTILPNGIELTPPLTTWEAFHSGSPLYKEWVKHYFDVLKNILKTGVN